MSKFNKTSARPATGTGFIASETSPSGQTFQGAPGYKRDSKSELFLLAVATMVGAPTFYESTEGRDSRFVSLIHEVAREDMPWMQDFLRWLRSGANMRTASIVGAVEAVYAGNKAGLEGWRKIVSSVLQRPDEPGEALAYFHGRYGRNLPKPIKRGIADGAIKLYAEYSLLKYDTASKGYRFADVLALTHPKPKTSTTDAVFGFAIDRRYNRDEIPKGLQMVANNHRLREAVAGGNYALLTNADALKAAGMTWEDVLSLAGDKVNKAALWEAMIPNMGYMALLRNLRNFDEAGVSDAVAATVATRLADPEEVAKSRQFPMRFLSAYRAAPSLRWSHPLDQALGHSLANIPELPGKTLILIDTSGSMSDRFSKDGSLNRADAATIFGLALAQRCASAEVVSFSNRTMIFPTIKGESLLRSMERWRNGRFFQGGGTDTAKSIRAHYKKDCTRVVVLTDEQSSWGGYGWGTSNVKVTDALPQTTPLYTWNLAGYEHGHAPDGPNRTTFGGLTDAAFRMIPLLESGRNGAWPWVK